MSYQFRAPPVSSLPTNNNATDVPLRRANSQQRLSAPVAGTRQQVQQPAQPQSTMISTSLNVRTLIVANKPRDPPPPQQQQQQQKQLPDRAPPTPPSSPPSSSVTAAAVMATGLTPSQAVAQYRLQEQGRNLPISTQRMMLPRGVQGQTVKRNSVSAAAGKGPLPAAAARSASSSSSSSSAPGSRSDARMALRNTRRNSLNDNPPAAESSQQSSSPPSAPQKPASSSPHLQRAMSSPGYRRGSVPDSSSSNDTSSAAPHLPPPAVPRIPSVSSSMQGTAAAITNNNSRASSRSGRPRAAAAAASSPATESATPIASSSSSSTFTLGTTTTMKPLKPKDAAAANVENYLSTGKFVDLLWPRSNLSSAASAAAVNAMTVVPLFVDADDDDDKKKKKDQEDDTSLHELNKAAPSSPRRGYVPTFLLYEQTSVPGEPEDIDCIWLSDSPFEYRTATVVFPPCDLEALPPGRRETKQSNADITRSVIAPPPLRRFWIDPSSSSSSSASAPPFSVVEPAIHAELLKLKECGIAAEQILTPSQADEMVKCAAAKEKKRQRGGGGGTEEGDSTSTTTAVAATADRSHDIILFRRAHNGFHRRVKRQGPNLRNITFFYSPSAARSSPALCVLRAGGLAEDYEVAHETVRSGDFSIWWAKGSTNAQMAVMDAAQKVNHFPGTWAIGRKDNLNKCLGAQLRRFGHEHYGFFPRGYLLPRDRNRLRLDIKAEKQRAMKRCREYRLAQEQFEKECEAARERRRHARVAKMWNEKKTVHHNDNNNNNSYDQQQESSSFLAVNIIDDDEEEEEEAMPSPPAILLQPPPRKSPMYIFKRVAGACGRGMRVLTKMPSASMGTGLVQEYIDRPLLVNGYKFDCRIYVAVTSFNPLRVYRYVEGLARFATTPYPVGQSGKASDKTAHLTNFSINRNNVGGEKQQQQQLKKEKVMSSKRKSSNVIDDDDDGRQQQQQQQQKAGRRASFVDSGTEDEEDDDYMDDDFLYDQQDGMDDEEEDYDDAQQQQQQETGAATAAAVDDDDDDGSDDDGDGGNAVPKWTYEMLHAWFEKNQPPGSWRTAWARIDDVIIKTLLACENQVTSTMRHIRPRERYPTCFFELFGFDILMQADLMPSIMEVNIMCSLESRCSPLDQYVKGNMLADLLTLVGVVPLGRQNKGPTPEAAAMAPSLQQVLDAVRRTVAAAAAAAKPKENVPAAAAAARDSDAPDASAEQDQQQQQQQSPTINNNDDTPPPLPPALDKKCRALHQATQLFWSSLSHPQLVDVIAYTEEERFRKGETWSRVYPPELSPDTCSDNENKNYFAGKYGRYYEEPRAADAALAQWHLLQSQAMELLKSASSSSGGGGGVGMKQLDVLNLLCNLRVLSPLFAGQ